MANQIVVSAGAKVRNLSGVLTATSGVVSFLPIDVSLGIPQLDVNGKILVSQLPNSVMEYKGTWSAATNTPTLVNGTGNQGDVYLCNVAGTVDFGAGPIAFFVGDQVIYSGSIWQRASGATGTVTSVAITETGDSLNITGSPITTSGTINIGFNGTNLQYVNGAGNLTTFPILTGYVTAVSGTAPVVSSGGTTPAISMAAATASVDGYLDNADWSTFNAKQNAITLTTTGTSGASTLVGATLNIPNYSSALTGYVPYTGATQDVDLGAFKLNAQSLHIKGTAGNGHLGLKHQSASATASANEVSLFADSLGDLGWLNGNLYLSKFITSGNTAARSYTFPNATCNIPNDSLVVHLAGTETITGAKTFSGGVTFTSSLTTTGNVTFSNSGFTLVLQPPTLSVNRTVTLPNGTGTLALTSDIPSITGLVPYTGATASVDLGAYLLTASGVDSVGYTARGSGTLSGYLIIKQGTTYLGNVVGYNSINANARKYVFISDVDGTNYKSAIFELSSLTNNTDRTYTLPDASGTIALVGGSGVGTVTSVAALTIGTSGTDLSSSVANGTTTPVITLNVPTASAANRGALSSADWTTFNNKQSALTNPVTYTGTPTTNYLPKFTGASTIGNSLVYDNGSALGINTTTLDTSGGIYTSVTVDSSTYSRYSLQSSGVAKGRFQFDATNVSLGTTATGGKLQLFTSAANAMEFLTNDTLRLTIASTGAATFSSDIQGGGDLYFNKATRTTIYPTTTNQNLHMKSNGSGVLQFNNDNTGNLTMCVGGGNVLIGTTDDGGKLVSYSTTAATQIKAAGTAPAITFSNTVLSPTIGGVLGACTASSQFLSGTASGDMVLANQFSGFRLYVASYSGGVYLTSGATSWTANSDIRLKNINSHIENAVEKLSTLQTINFSYKDDKFKKQNLGLIAQEVEKIFPELIDKNGDGMLGVRYTELVPVLIKAVQELKAEIETLKNK
jgi:hypothetical protein